MTVVMRTQPDVEGAALLTPVVYLSKPPPDAMSFSRYRRAVAMLLDEQDIAGVVLVSANWLSEAASPNVVLHVDLRDTPLADEIVILAETVATRLERAGLSVDLEECHETSRLPDALAMFEPQRFPMLHVSVPINFGPDLMIVVGAALAQLRKRGVLLAACAESFDAASHASSAPRELRRERWWVHGQVVPQYGDIYPLLVMVAATREEDKLYELSQLPHSEVVVGLGAHPGLQRVAEKRHEKARPQGPRNSDGV
ncbi:MAG: hypothetical protein WC538_03260 [Thermoanaerobaculia bacterium]|jgi:hypothetical protein